MFISHAAPEDNAFTLWLGAKLAAMGYEVWADVLRLRGGDDWQRKLEHALRHRARKVLLVGNPRAVEKQGVRNEIQIASDVARKIGDTEFVIPLRMAPFEAPFLIAHAQYIDFQRGWAAGLAELLETVDQTYRVPRGSVNGSAIWREIQLIHAKAVVAKPERLVSNWLAIDQLPAKIRYFDFKAGSERLAQARIKDSPCPVVPFRRGFLTFARYHDLQEHFGAHLPLKLESERTTHWFLEEGWPKLDIARWDARNKFSDLARQALESLFRSRGLKGYQLSGWQQAWWAPVDVAPTTKVAFRWDDIAGLRQIQGVSAKRQMNWHFGVSVAARTAPFRHVRILSRLIFTEDGHKPFDDPAKMHRLRRSFAKTWRKTIFLCRYLCQEKFRREIHEGLNVVENRNSATSFVFFGKGGEIATNRLDDQESAALALHLLQNCLVYVNTRMMQAVLAEPKWSVRLTPEDYRGLTPLIYGHVNPYGRFDLNLNRRIDFEQTQAA